MKEQYSLVVISHLQKGHTACHSNDNTASITLNESNICRHWDKKKQLLAYVSHLPLVPMQQGRPLMLQSMCLWPVWFQLFGCVHTWRRTSHQLSHIHTSSYCISCYRHRECNRRNRFFKERNGYWSKIKRMSPHRPLGDVIRPCVRLYRGRHFTYSAHNTGNKSNKHILAEEIHDNIWLAP